MRKYTDELVWALSTLTPSDQYQDRFDPVHVSRADAERIRHMLCSLEDKVAMCEASVRGANHERDWAVKELNNMNESLRVLVGNRKTGEVRPSNSMSTLKLQSDEFVVCRIIGGDFVSTISNSVKVDWHGNAIPWPAVQESA